MKTLLLIGLGVLIGLVICVIAAIVLFAKFLNEIWSGWK